jgi:Tfp pilus assembly protein PilV
MKTRLKTLPPGLARRAFSLLEVMIAIGLFFMAVFAVLGLVTISLQNARHLKRPLVDAAQVTAWLSSTNILIENTYSGNLSEYLGKPYQGYTWTYAVREVESNHLYQVDFILQDGNSFGHPVVSKMSVQMYRPLSPPGSLDGGMGR